VAKPRSTQNPRFPFQFEKNGRTGRIKFWKSSGTFGTHFRFGGRAFRNSFKTFAAASSFLDREFSTLDTNRADSLSLHPINHDVKTYHELEQLLRDEGGAANLREAVEFFLVHHKHRRFIPLTVARCIELFLEVERARNLSSAQVGILEKHLNRFAKSFGSGKIHEVTAQEIWQWLATQRRKDGKLWSAKTRRNVRGSLVTMSLHAQSILRAIPDMGKTEFQRVKNPKKDRKAEVEIYTPPEFTKLLNAALASDIYLLPGLVVGGFEGLRPHEFHAEAADRPPLKWEALNWADMLVHVIGQKVRSKQTRDVPFHRAAQAWLKPFRGLKGEIWPHKKAWDDKVLSLCKEAGVVKIYDGFRRSYASYRIRHLKGDLSTLAEEMGNSPTEIINSYKRNVSDKQADEWFAIMPPPGYAAKIRVALKLRKLARFRRVKSDEVV
jgi:integrase